MTTFVATSGALSLLAKLLGVQGSGTSRFPKPRGNDVGVGVFALGELVTSSLASNPG